MTSSLITVALGFIGAEGGIAVFVLDKRDNLFFFYLIALLAVIVLTLSVVFGGLGIRKAYNDGFHGHWLLADKGEFSKQSVCCLFGAGIVLLSSVLGTPKLESQHVDVRLIPSNGVTEVQHQVDKLSADLEEVKKQLDILRNARSQIDKRQKVPRKPDKR